MHRFVLPLLAVVTLVGCSNASNNRSEFVREEYIHKYGVAVSKEEWGERGSDGRVVTTKQDGIVITRSYRVGVLEGDTTITFPHSRTIETLQTYSEGNLVRQVNHYPSGMPKEEERYTANQGKVITAWYEAGTPKSVETFEGEYLIKGEFYAQNDEVESRVANGAGTRTVRDSYGQLLSRDTVANGHIVTVTRYHPNDTPSEIVPYANNQIHGAVKTFLANGEPDKVESWVKGVQEGITVAFRNGEKQTEIPYINGRPHGTERRYNGSELVEEITWANGRQHGPAVSFVEGESRTNWYYNGKVVSKVVFDEMKESIR